MEDGDIDVNCPEPDMMDLDENILNQFLRNHVDSEDEDESIQLQWVNEHYNEESKYTHDKDDALIEFYNKKNTIDNGAFVVKNREKNNRYDQSQQELYQ